MKEKHEGVSKRKNKEEDKEEEEEEEGRWKRHEEKKFNVSFFLF